MRSTLGRTTWSIFTAVAMSLATLGVMTPPTGAATTATISIGTASVWEGNSGGVRLLTFSVALNQPVTAAASVQYKLVTGTATTADFDDLGGATRTLSFLPGGATTKFITVSVKPDTLDEANETFTVSLFNPTGATLRNSSAAGTILDDDPGSGVRLGIGDVAVSEGDSGPAHSATFWATLSQPATTTVTAHAMTMSGSATEGVDYNAKMANLSFAVGELRKAFTVTVKPDITVEPDETFTVMLSNVTGATLADGTGVGRIISEERSSFTTKSYLIGPFNLAAKGQPGWQNESTQNPVPRPAGAIGIKGMRFDIVDQSGTPVGMHDVHLHHVVLLDHSRTDAVCPSLPFNRFSASGMERTPLALGSDYAYRVGAADTWSALWHIMNQTSQAKTVYIKYDIDYVAATSPLAAKGVTSYWYDVDGCWGDSAFNVPGNGGPGSIYTLSRTYTAPRNGTRVSTGGHLHDGGIDITLKRTPSGTVVCTNTAMYDLGLLHSITACPTSSSITASEQFTTTARYRNEAPIAGAMGIQVSYVWEP